MLPAAERHASWGSCIEARESGQVQITPVAPCFAFAARGTSQAPPAPVPPSTPSLSQQLAPVCAWLTQPPAALCSPTSTALGFLSPGAGCRGDWSQNAASSGVRQGGEVSRHGTKNGTQNGPCLLLLCSQLQLKAFHTPPLCTMASRAWEPATWLGSSWSPVQTLTPTPQAGGTTNMLHPWESRATGLEGSHPVQALPKAGSAPGPRLLWVNASACDSARPGPCCGAARRGRGELLLAPGRDLGQRTWRMSRKPSHWGRLIKAVTKQRAQPGTKLTPCQNSSG